MLFRQLCAIPIHDQKDELICLYEHILLSSCLVPHVLHLQYAFLVKLFFVVALYDAKTLHDLYHLDILQLLWSQSNFLYPLRHYESQL